MADAADLPPLTAAAVQALLRTRSVGRVLHVLPQVDSTNRAALDLAQAGAPDGTVVVAEEQTAGRGRLGRSWHSPPGENLYCSILLRRLAPPERLANWLSWIPLVSGLAVLRTVESLTTLQPSLKWPNDVFVGSRKVGGVLCESSGIGTPAAAVVVGLGVNVNVSRETFPLELQAIATSLAAETGHRIDRVALLAELLREIETRFEFLLSDRPALVRDEYSRVCATIGRQVLVRLATGETLQGLADSIDADGGLRLIQEGSGQLMTVRAGDVVHLR